MDYLTVQQTAERWGVTPRWVQALIKRGRIGEVMRFGHAWMIPKDAENLLTDENITAAAQKKRVGQR